MNTLRDGNNRLWLTALVECASCKKTATGYVYADANFRNDGFIEFDATIERCDEFTHVIDRKKALFGWYCKACVRQQKGLIL